MVWFRLGLGKYFILMPYTDEAKTSDGRFNYYFGRNFLNGRV